jgi:hypothetical protein
MKSRPGLTRFYSAIQSVVKLNIELALSSPKREAKLNCTCIGGENKIPPRRFHLVDALPFRP